MLLWILKMIRQGWTNEKGQRTTNENMRHLVRINTRQLFNQAANLKPAAIHKPAIQD
jgi:hypothetical protein